MTLERRPRSSEPASKQKLRLWLGLLRAARAIEGELRARLGDGMTMTELSRLLMVSNGNVTGIIDRLAAEGMVVRLAHQGDRRATFVRLTAKGTQHFSAMAKAHEAWVAELLAGLGREDTDTLVGLLGTLRAPANGRSQSP